MARSPSTSMTGTCSTNSNALLRCLPNLYCCIFVKSHQYAANKNNNNMRNKARGGRGGDEGGEEKKSILFDLEQGRGGGPMEHNYDSQYYIVLASRCFRVRTIRIIFSLHTTNTSLLTRTRGRCCVVGRSFAPRIVSYVQWGHLGYGSRVSILLWGR